MTRRQLWGGLAVAAGLAALAAALWAARAHLGSALEILERLEQLDWAWFIALLATLPLVGVPISIFLALLGVRFGVGGGLAVAALLFPLHLLAAYGLCHSVLRPWAERLLARFDVRLPRVPAQRAATAAFLLFAVPGPSYLMKLLGVALSGVPLRHYLWTGWLTNVVWSVPFIGLGRSAADLDWPTLLGYAGLLIGGFAAGHWLWRRRKAWTR